VAQIYLSFTLNATTPTSRASEVEDTLARLKDGGMQGRDISDDEFAKSHARYLIGGKHEVPHERIFRFGELAHTLLDIVGHAPTFTCRVPGKARRIALFPVWITFFARLEYLSIPLP